MKFFVSRDFLMDFSISQDFLWGGEGLEFFLKEWKIGEERHEVSENCSGGAGEARRFFFFSLFLIILRI